MVGVRKEVDQLEGEWHRFSSSRVQISFSPSFLIVSVDQWGSVGQLYIRFKALWSIL